MKTWKNRPHKLPNQPKSSPNLNSCSLRRWWFVSFYSLVIFVNWHYNDCLCTRMTTIANNQLLLYFLRFVMVMLVKNILRRKLSTLLFKYFFCYCSAKKTTWLYLSNYVLFLACYWLRDDSNFAFVKVYIFWEGLKILRNLHFTFN